MKRLHEIVGSALVKDRHSLSEALDAACSSAVLAGASPLDCVRALFRAAITFARAKNQLGSLPVVFETVLQDERTGVGVVRARLDAMTKPASDEQIMIALANVVATFTVEADLNPDLLVPTVQAQLSYLLAEGTHDVN